MTRDERRAAIGGPVAVRGAEISPVLLTRLVNDVGDDPDQLSILQHALNRTWAKWQEQDGIGPLDLKHYEEIGTMAAALDKHVEEAFAELADERKRKICEKLFKALTDKGTDARGIRRPTKLGTLRALCEADEPGVKEVIDVFREPQRSFLMPPASEELADDTVIDISHESLMRIWQRLNGWADEEAKSAEIYRKLRADAELYKRAERSLWRDPELRIALNWRAENQPTEAWAELYGSGFSQAMQFLDESAEAQRRSRLWKRIWLSGLIIAAFVGVVFWADSIQRKKEKLQKQKEELQKQVDELRGATPELQKEVQHLREENRSLRLEVSKLQHENQWLQTTIQSTKEYNERLRHFADQVGRTIRELAAREDGLKKASSSFAAERDELRREEEQLREFAERLDAKNRELRENLLAKGFLPLRLPMLKRAELGSGGGRGEKSGEAYFPTYGKSLLDIPDSPPKPEPSPDEVVDLQMLRDVLQKENLLLKMLGDELRAENQKLAKETADSSTTNKTLRAELAQLQSEEKNLDQEVASLQNEVETLQGKVSQLTDENSTLQMEIWSLAAKNAALVQWSNHLGGDNQIMKEALARGRSRRGRLPKSGGATNGTDVIRPVELKEGLFQARVSTLNRQMGSNSNDRVAEIYDAALKDGAGNQMNAAALRDKLGLVALPEGADAKAKRDQVFAAINDLSSGKDESKLQLWESLFKAHPERPGDLDTIPLPP